MNVLATDGNGRVEEDNVQGMGDNPDGSSVGKTLPLLSSYPENIFDPFRAVLLVLVLE